MEIPRFTHGIVVVDSNTLVEKNELEVLYFVGLTYEPDEEAMEQVKKEAETEEEIGLQLIYDRCLYLKAPKELVEFYNMIVEETEEDDIDNKDIEEGESEDLEL